MEEQKEAYLQSLSQEKAVFEKEVKNLLSVTFGETFFFGFGGKKAFDLEARRTFFTDEGWADYMSYIEQQRAELRQDYEQTYIKQPPQTGKPREPNTLFYMSEFKPWSQSYKISEDGKMIFSAEGARKRGYYDTYFFGPDFSLSVVIKGNLEKDPKFLIEKWQFKMTKSETVPHGR